MVLGLARSRTRLAGPASRALSRNTPQRDAARHWIVERGEIVFEASCDVVGSFPGYAELGSRLDGVNLRVTERYLLVGDGNPHGFGLPIRGLDGIALIALGGRDEFGLRMFYQDGVSPRLFTARFRGNRLALRSGPRAERARLALLRVGLRDRFAASLPAEPQFTVPWDQTGDFEAENVIWTGRATAPQQIGLDGVPCNVWLTTRSLIWGCEAIEGVHRVPLALLTDVAAASVVDRNATPAAYVGLGDETTGHYDLAFLFDQQSTADCNLRERGAFVVGLRSRGIPIGTPTPPFQPWRLDARPPLVRADALTICDSYELEEEVGTAEWLETAFAPQPPSRRRLGVFEMPPDAVIAVDWPEQVDADAIAPVAVDPPANHLDTPASRLWETDWTDAQVLSDVVLAEWSTPPLSDQELHDDVQVSARWAVPPQLEAETQEFDAATPLPATDSSADDEPRNPAPPSAAPDEEAADPAGPPAQSFAERQTDALPESTRWPRVAAYESAAVGVLEEILAAIRDRAAGAAPAPLTSRPPTPADQASVLAELNALAAGGSVSADELRSRAARVVSLGDACVRLGTLLELRDAGHVSDADLARRRRAITAQLAAVIDVR